MGEYRKLGNWFFVFEWPEITCPTCKKSLVTTQGGDISFDETTESSGFNTGKRRDPEWEPSWIKGVFHGFLMCQNRRCLEKLFVMGRWTMEPGIFEDENGETIQDWEKSLLLEYFSPPLALTDPLPPSAPQFIHERIAEVSKLIWIDHNAAGTRIRCAVEQILDDLGVPNKGSLHHRIEAFEKQNVLGAAALLAIKHLGNESTHELSLEKSEVFDSLEFFESALRAIYIEPTSEVQSKIDQVNNSHQL